MCIRKHNLPHPLQKKCQVQYVGESSNTLRTRLNNPRFDINTNRETPVGRHFNLPDHSLALLQVTGTERNFRSNILRKQRESYFIHKMKTLTPNGLNIDFRVFSDLSIT